MEDGKQTLAEKKKEEWWETGEAENGVQGLSRCRVGGAGRPDAARLRAQDCVVAAASAGLAAAGRTRRRAPERRGAGRRRAQPPAARRAPRAPPRSFPPALRRRSAPVLPLPPPSLPPSPGEPRAPDGELAVASRARPLRLTWAPAPSPETRPPVTPLRPAGPGGRRGRPSARGSFPRLLRAAGRKRRRRPESGRAA
ncbi:hypothetical protein AB1E18_003572 [Capra hircus]